MRRVRDIPAPIVALRINVAESYGADRMLILKDANISLEDITNPKARITVEQVVDVWKSIISQTDFHDIGLECGLKARFQTMGVLGYVMINSPSIIHAWTKFCNYQELVLALLLHKMTIEGDLVRIAGIIQEEWQEDFRYTVDFIYTSCFTLIKNCTAKNIHPIEIGFNFEQPDNIERYHSIYDPAIIKFACDQPYIIYRKSDLDHPITAYDTGMYEHFDRMLKEVADDHNQIDATSRTVKNIVIDKLKASVPKIDEVASEMAMSVSSVQQHLKKEGTSFQRILNDVRKQIAIKQLSNSQNNITDVAFLTGFSSISTFSRTFKKWTGLSPSDFQNQN
jgi:AraC-like DNA-binding protein